ncbi:MAG: transcription elongation factor GreA [Sphaerochaetaceae bacterium]|nr:transcription elongation factor GreA [Sphaerochaetaceae bacterium]
MNEDAIRSLLTEEAWTRTALTTYTVPMFQEIDTTIAGIQGSEDLLEVKSICDEHLKKNKNSIAALYISGIISVMRKSFDYGNITNLIEMFIENGKDGIAEFLSLKVLDAFEDKYVLRILASIYEKQGKREEAYALYERLVAVDFEETELLITLAEKALEQDQREKAIAYYKKAFQRYLNAQSYQSVIEVFTILFDMMPDEFPYVLSLAERIAEKFNGEPAFKPIGALYQRSLEHDNYDNAIDAMKTILDFSPTNDWAREQLVATYKKKYANHSRLASCIESSNLDKAYRDIHLAINEFEKNIAFDKGSFVFHKSWAIGRIKEITSEHVIIDFPSKRGHSMSLAMAFSSLQVLPAQHIWVLKSLFPKDKLKEKFITDVPWGLRTLIQSNGNAATLKTMKSEIVPSILSAKEWTSWLNKAKKVLMNDPLIGFLPNASDVYTVRETPISYEEKSLGIFRNEKRFYAKVKIIRDFLINGDVESDFFIEMVKYFRDQCSIYQGVTDQVISSYLLVDYLARRYPFIARPEGAEFKHLYGMLDSIEQTFEAIEDAELKKAFIDKVVETEDPERVPVVLVSLYPYYLTNYIMDTLREQGKNRVISDMFKKACRNYKENADLFTYLSRSYDRKFWEKKIRIPFETLITSQLQLLDYAFNAIEAKRATAENKKIVKTLLTILFDERSLYQFLDEANEGQAQRINFIIQRMESLEMSKKLEVKHVILERFPDFVFLGEDLDSKEMVSSGLMVTRTRYIEKQNELDHIMNVEIPENSKEIGAALELGDLRENSEFKAAKEKQGILNATMVKLTDEISRANVITKEQIDVSKVSFGTKVTLKNNITGDMQEYRILGPWESNPNENTISYMAPFGAKLLNHTPGERFTFDINEKPYDFTVESIEAIAI